MGVSVTEDMTRTAGVPEAFIASTFVADTSRLCVYTARAVAMARLYAELSCSEREVYDSFLAALERRCCGGA